MVPFPPLDSPKPSFEPLSEAFAAKRGLRGLGSVRRAGFGTLVRPEFTCTGSASIKNEALEHQTHLWAPRF